MPSTSPAHKNSLGAIASVALFSSLALSSNYVLTGLPNVKLMDLVVFVAAFAYGLKVGVSVALVTWMVYGNINPYGVAGFPLLPVLMVSESIYAVLGYGLHRYGTSFSRSETPLVSTASLFGVAGVVGAFLYDLVTNAFTGVFFYGSLWTGIVTGIPFAIVHEFSNLVFFSLAAPTLVLALEKITHRSCSS